MGFYGKKISRSEIIKAHAKKRIQQRFNLPGKTLVVLATMIREGKSEFVEKQSNSISIHDVTYDNQVLRCVYNTRTKIIKTVMRI